MKTVSCICNSCSNQIIVDDESLLGEDVLCPHCNAELYVPLPETDSKALESVTVEANDNASKPFEVKHANDHFNPIADHVLKNNFREKEKIWIDSPLAKNECPVCRKVNSRVSFSVKKNLEMLWNIENLLSPPRTCNNCGTIWKPHCPAWKAVIAGTTGITLVPLGLYINLGDEWFYSLMFKILICSLGITGVALAGRAFHQKKDLVSIVKRGSVKRNVSNVTGFQDFFKEQ